MVFALKKILQWHLLKGTAALAVSAVVATFALAVYSPGAHAHHGANELIFAGCSEGTWRENLKFAFFEPFEKETGTKVVCVSAGVAERLTKIAAMQQVGKVEWDMIPSREGQIRAQRANFETLDCSKIKPGARVLPNTCRDFAYLSLLTGNPVVVSDKAYPPGKPRPATWADFFDVQKFPGVRGMPSYGSPEIALMMALLADGVPADKLFPLDVDRAFRKLDQLKPHVGLWWKSGSSVVNAFRSGEIAMSWVWIGTSVIVQNEKIASPVPTLATEELSYWAVLKNAPHKENAIKFIEFFTKNKEALAEFTRREGYLTPSIEANALLSSADRAKLGADHIASYVKINEEWVTQNRPAIVDRWNQWVSK